MLCALKETTQLVLHYAVRLFVVVELLHLVGDRVYLFYYGINAIEMRLRVKLDLLNRLVLFYVADLSLELRLDLAVQFAELVCNQLL